MKCLIIGNADSVWIKMVIEQTLLKYGDQVDILTIENKVFKKFYKDNSINVYKIKLLKGKIGILFAGITNWKILKKKYDIICVHYMNSRSACMIPIAHLFCKNIIVSFWGSDLLRENKRKWMTYLSFFFVRSFSISTSEMKEKFISLYGRRFIQKIRYTHFGSDVIELIKNSSCDSKMLRKRYGIDEDKIVISIGYNSSPEQQHISVIKSIMTLPREKIHIILRITYGVGDDNYIREIKTLIKKTGFTYSVFETFLSDMEIAEITAITDIFIHAQTTDARSATVREHLYAQCILVHPTWINYSDLEDIFYISFNEFDELAAMIADNLVKKEDSAFKKELLSNRDKIYRLISWETFIPGWRDLYQSKGNG